MNSAGENDGAHLLTGALRNGFLACRFSVHSSLPLAIDVARDPEHIPERDPTWRNRDGTKDDRADEGLPPFWKREVSPASSTESPYVQTPHGLSPFAPPATLTSSPFPPSSFVPPPFSSSSLSSSSSPVLASRLPPVYTGNLLSLGTCRRNQALAGGVANATPDAAQFRLIKSWLHHIRLFLRRSQGSPTIVWGELMKIRSIGWQEDAAVSSQQDSLRGEAQKDSGAGNGMDNSVSWPGGDGLIGFFEEKIRT
ncbi:hypothetical protein BJY52DRAFT_1402746 [Lactarius psammicola]|nr:hypothetical protein BJY52DRAFT_1402746 [Lactarius psammicola]